MMKGSLKMNNSYNYSFLIDRKPNLATQHIAFEKRPSEENSSLRSPPNLAQENLNRTTLSQEL